MKTEACGPTTSPQMSEKDNSLFSGREHKISASSIYFMAPDWCPHTQTITWDTGYYKAVDGKIIDIVADHHACPTPAQMRGIQQAHNHDGDTAGRWWPCRIGYTEYNKQITQFWKNKHLRPVIIIPIGKVDGEGGAV